MRVLRLTLVAVFIYSCSSDVKTGDQLSSEQKAYLHKLGLLDKHEKVHLFNSQAGFNGWKQGGNFFSDRRISSYWIDEQDTTKTKINSAYYTEVDTIWRYPKFNALTLSSYLEVHQKNGKKFKVYVSADSLQTWRFFNKSLEAWYKQRDATEAKH